MSALLLITGTIQLPAEKLPEARAAMAEMIRASRAEPGCLHYSYAQDILVPDIIHVTEKWASADALAVHFASDHIVQWRRTWADLGISDRDLTLYEISSHRPT
ncbi:MAG: antibiotic biosynthesis monooxygenase [Sphingobium sp.]|nr:antibiotic biosynthesis monooxygenase [Sphingobium sp.]